MGGVDGAGERFHQVGSRGCRHRVANQITRQAASFHEFQRKEWSALVFPDLIDLHDVRMLQASQRLRFAAKSVELLWIQMRSTLNHLEGDPATELSLPRLVHDSHSAYAQDFQEFITGHAWQAGLPLDRRTMRGPILGSNRG